MAKEKESEGGGRKMKRCGCRGLGGGGRDGLFANERVHRANSEVNEETDLDCFGFFFVCFFRSQNQKLGCST